MSAPDCMGKQRDAKRPSSRLLAALLALLLTMTGFSQFTPTACKRVESAGQPDGNGRIKVITTVFATYDFTRQIAGSHVEVKMLIPPGMEPHSYEPTPQDILDIAQCNLFIYIGGESDSWILDLLSSIDTSDMEILRLMDCVVLLQEDDTVLIDSGAWINRESETDEHIWTSISNARLITWAIAARLMALDPENSDAIDAATREYILQLDELDVLIQGIVTDAKRATLIFGDRFPFTYFAADYGLECRAAFPGCSSATEASARTVALLIDNVRQEGIPAVFYIELSNHRIATTIANETGTQALLMNSCHNISAQDFTNGETYLSLMRKNAENLKVALN